MFKMWSFTQRVTVQEGGKVELTLPETTPGEVVDLVVTVERRPVKVRRAGSLRGKIRLGPEFDEPVPGMELYE